MARNLTGKAKTLTLSVTPGLLAHLEQLSLTHVYGTKAAETAEIIIQQEIRRLITSGGFNLLKSQLPNLVPEDDAESEDAK